MKKSILVRIRTLFASLLLGVGASLVTTAAELPRPRYAEGELLVKFKGGARSHAADAARERMKHDVKRRFDFIGWQHIRLPRGMSVEEGLALYNAMPEVLAAEPNYGAQAIDSTAGESAQAVSQLTAPPNDTRFSQQWGLQRVGVSNAWNVTTGDSNVVVAVLDTGILYNHEDLRDNMWRNPGEIPANGIDDDGNGYVDDVYGIDTVDDEFGNDSDPIDRGYINGASPIYHGTVCAGVIGAAGNNGKGIAGVNWSVQLMAVRVIRATNWIDGAEEIEALDYCLRMKQRGVNLKVVSMSYFIDSGLSQAVSDAHDAIGNAGIVQVVAAGNNASDNDVLPWFPASYLSPGLIAVANSDQSDGLFSRSNYGRASVDLAAPGRDIQTTSGPLDDSYGAFNGTSLSCPHVSGAAALLFAAYPSATAVDVKDALLRGVDLLPAFTNKVVSHGRLNIGRAMQVYAPTRHVPTQYATIQAAVDAAASGDTIRIAAGDYREQVLIADKGTLTLAGEPGTVIRATTSMRRILEPFGANTYPIIGIVRSEVVLGDITFEGERLGNVYTNAFFGIFFRGSGGRVENCTIRGFRGNTSTDARAINVVNAVSFGSSAVEIAIRNNSFTDNFRSVVLSGDEANNPTLLRTRFTIEGNSFTGLGPDSTQAHLAVFILTGAGGDFRANTITGYSYSGPNTGFSGGILAHDGRFNPTRGFIPVQPVRYEGNRFLTNDHGLVLVAANDSQVVSNIFEGTARGVIRWGAVAVSGTNILVEGNDFAELPIGIELFGGDKNGTTLRGVATNPKLFSNHFCRVTEPVYAQPLANGIDEQGRETCQDPPPPPRTRNVPADYVTIQSAVNAANSGDTVRIGAGDYREQIVIANKGRLTLVGEPGAVIHATTTMTETLRPYNWLFVPLLGIFRSDVVVSGLTFDGQHHGDLYSILIGVYYLGSSGEMSNCTLRGFREPTLTTRGTDGVRIQNAVAVGAPAVDVRIVDNTFEDNEASIHMRGEPVDNPTLLRTTFLIEGNSITGTGPGAGPFDGIKLRNGASGEVKGNVIRNHTYTGAGEGFASGIAAYDDNANNTNRPALAFVPLFPVRYEGNTFLNNDEHLVIIGGNDSQVVNNTFVGGGPNESRWGALAVSGTNTTIAHNNFSGMFTGVVLFGDDHLFAGWPRIAPATNVRLDDNWFCNVTLPIDPHALVTGVVEEGTQRCEVRPFEPLFRSVSQGNGSMEVTLRAWHGQSVVIETSTDLQQWVPVHTNATLPTVLFRDAEMGSSPRRFYRAVYR